MVFFRRQNYSFVIIDEYKAYIITYLPVFMLFLCVLNFAKIVRIIIQSDYFLLNRLYSLLRTKKDVYIYLGNGKGITIRHYTIIYPSRDSKMKTYNAISPSIRTNALYISNYNLAAK